MTFHPPTLANALRSAHARAAMRVSSIGSTGGIGIDRVDLHVLK